MPRHHTGGKASLQKPVELTKETSNTNYENNGPGGIEDLPVLSLHSMESDSQDSNKKISFARRLTKGTLKGLGLSQETDFNKVRLMQKTRALSISGQTQATQKANQLFGQLQGVVQESDDEVSPVSIKVPKLDRSDINAAFMKDIKEFNLESTSGEAKSITSERDALPVIDQSLRISADIDNLALASLDKDTTPVSKRRRSSSGAPTLDHLYKVKKTDAKAAPLEAIMSAQEFDLPSIPAEPSLKEITPSKGRRQTVYENYDTRRKSEKVAHLRRFRSADQSPVAMGQWDNFMRNLISEKLNESKLKKDGRKAMLKTKAAGDGVRSPEQFAYTKNLTFLQAFSSDGHVGKSEKNLLEEPVFYRSLPSGGTKEDYLYGNEALEHYNIYIAIEKEVLAEQLKEDKFRIKLKLNEKKGKIREALALAKEHYCTDYGIASKLRKQMTSVKDKVSGHKSGAKLFEKTTGIREQLESLTTYTPWFIMAVTLLQAIAILIEVGLGGVVPISFSQKQLVEKYETWNGLESVTHFLPTNLWIGPSKLTLVQLGAMFAPCLRKDYIFTRRLERYREQLEEGLGCCEVIGIGAGTTDQKQCEKMAENYVWINTTCNKRNIRNIGRPFETHKFKPCCHGDIGQCSLITHTHCLFLDGIWHPDTSESCAQVHCGWDLCSSNHIHSVGAELVSHFSGYGNDTIPFDPSAPLQYWRLFVSLFYHNGILHFLIIAILQCIMGLDVEKVAGWLRMAAIYCVSGYGGLLFGTVAKPYEPNVGADGAAFGLIAMNYIELAQAWSLVDKPHRSFFKLLFVTVLALTSGFIPQINIFKQMTGFWIGLLMSVICLPYVTFNRWHSGARRLMVSLAFLLVLGSIAAILFLLHTVQPDGVGSRNSHRCVLDNECSFGPSILNAL